MINVQFVSPEKSWILEKIARKLAECGAAEDIAMSIGERPNADADINYYFNWYTWHALGRPATKHNLLYFTHQNLDNSDAFVRDLLTAADHTTTMSTWERDKLIRLGVPADKLTCILPAMDAGWEPRLLRLGITCRYYGDGRRCDDDIIEVARNGALAGYELIVIGTGWEALMQRVAGYGVKVRIFPGSGDYLRDYDELNHRIVPELDYLWNVGRDTTLGVLDALACGVPIISQPTSFALDFAVEGDAALWYENAGGLEILLKAIMRGRRHIGDVARGRTWEAYGAELAQLLRRLAG